MIWYFLDASSITFFRQNLGYLIGQEQNYLRNTNQLSNCRSHHPCSMFVPFISSESFDFYRKPPAFSVSWWIRQIEWSKMKRSIRVHHSNHTEHLTVSQFRFYLVRTCESAFLRQLIQDGNTESRFSFQTLRLSAWLIPTSKKKGRYLTEKPGRTPKQRIHVIRQLSIPAEPQNSNPGAPLSLSVSVGKSSNRWKLRKIRWSEREKDMRSKKWACPNRRERECINADYTEASSRRAATHEIPLQRIHFVVETDTSFLSHFHFFLLGPHHLQSQKEGN